MFRRNRARILDLSAVYDYWVGQAPLLQNQLDEVLRAELVQTVSAFDTFIHDCVRIGIVNKFISSGVLSSSLKEYSIPFEDFEAINQASDLNWVFKSQVKKFIKRFWKNPYRREDENWMQKLVDAHHVRVQSKFAELNKLI